MLTVDSALTLYTDQILQNNNNNTDTNIIIQQLNPADINEFLEAVKSIRVLCAFHSGNKFDDFFANLNNYKEEIESLPTAADFRGKGGAEVEKQIDSIFLEEFGDD